MANICSPYGTVLFIPLQFCVVLFTNLLKSGGYGQFYVAPQIWLLSREGWNIVSFTIIFLITFETNFDKNANNQN